MEALDIFAWRVDAIMAELRAGLPASSRRSRRFAAVRRPARAASALTAVSIDTACSERRARSRVRARFEWATWALVGLEPFWTVRGTAASELGTSGRDDSAAACVPARRLWRS